MTATSICEKSLRTLLRCRSVKGPAIKSRGKKSITPNYYLNLWVHVSVWRNLLIPQRFKKMSAKPMS